MQSIIEEQRAGRPLRRRLWLCLSRESQGIGSVIDPSIGLVSMADCGCAPAPL